MLGDHRDVVGADAQLGQRPGQRGVLAPTPGAQRAQARGRDRRVHTVGERLRVANNREHRQTHLDREIPAGQQNRAAALGFQEAEPAPVVGPGEPCVADAPAAHHARVGGGGHVTEADDGLQRQVVEAARNHQLGLAEADLVDALLDGDRRGGARPDRVDHRAVTADVGLNHMCGNNIRQHFLQDVVWLGPAE